MLGWLKKRILRSPVASAMSGPRIIRAKYDAANPQDADNEEHWRRGVDSYAADTANSPAVRKRLRERARYETDNNSYLFGVVDTLVNDMVGSGPMLQLSGDPDIPASVAKFAEAEWEQWRLHSGLDEALQTLDRSKRIDGEGFGLLTDNPAIPGPVKLVLQTVESEQVTDPSASNDPKNIDGVLLNDAGHVVGYRMLKSHPGGLAPSLDVKSVKPESMIHWFRPRRPGQHRGITDMVACLKLMPMLRRYTLATVRTAEIQAANGGVLETDVEPGDFDPSVLPEDTINYVRGMITALPPGYKFRGFEPTQPIANMDMFVRTLLQEAGRGLNVPLVVMLMNASGFNFASGRLDHLIYWKGQRIDRVRFIKRVVHPIFLAWWREWRFARSMTHLKEMPAADFIFPGFEFLDVKNETAASVEQIGAGLATPEDFWTASGKDPEKMRRKVERWAKWGKEHGFVSAPAASIEEEDEAN